MWPKVTLLSSVCQVAARPAAGAQRRDFDDLVAAGDQAPHRLDREQVAGARLQAGPAGAAERGGEAGAVGDPRSLAVAQAVELAQRLLGLAGVADHAEPAALAAADRAAPGPGWAESQPKSGSPQAGQGGLSGPAPASSGTTGVGCASLMRGSVRRRAASRAER